MKKCDKAAYKSAYNALDIEDAYNSVCLCKAFDGTIDAFKDMVKSAAKEAVKQVAECGFNQYVVDTYPIRAYSWYDSGDIFCEIIVYLQGSVGINERKARKEADFCE